jgi:hypothetical protein
VSSNLPAAADEVVMRSVIGLCALGGTIAGSYVPVLWGGSSLSFVSLLFGALGGVGGIWLGVRLST